MRILHIAYQQIKRLGKTRVNWAQKLSYGLIKNNHFVLDFSDRDMAAFYGPLGIRDLGKTKANKLLLEVVANFDPDLIIAGHCDIISNETLREARQLAPRASMVHCNLDPLFAASNVVRIRHRAEIVDAVFVSTGSRELMQFADTGKRFYHIPNPVDASIECFDNSEKTADQLPIDLIFCSNSNELTRRLEIVKFLKENLDAKVNFKTYGSFGEPPIWGHDYDIGLSRSRMALNLNRQEGLHWYSSERMAQLAGNGILQFAHDSGRFDELLPPETLVYFSDEHDLKTKIEMFHGNDEQRRTWAKNTRQFFHTEVNTALFSQYIVEAALQQPFSHDYVWARDIHLDGSRK